MIGHYLFEKSEEYLMDDKIVRGTLLAIAIGVLDACTYIGALLLVCCAIGKFSKED